MVQKKGGSGPPPRRQDKAQSAQSKLNHKNTHTTNRRPQKDIEVVTNKHREIATALVNDESIDLDDYKNVFLESGKYGSNLLHWILVELKGADKEGGRKPASKQVLASVERLVIHNPELFIQKSTFNTIPLLDAASDKLEILFQVVNLVIPDAVLANLETSCSGRGQKCPLESVNELLLEKFPLDESGTGSAARDERDKRTEHDKVRVSESARAAEAGRGRPQGCLHSKIDIPKLKEKNEAIKKALSDGLSLRMRTSWPCFQSLMNARNFDRTLYPKDDVPMIPQESFRFLLQLCPDNLFDSPAEDGLSPLQMAIQLYTDPTVDYRHLVLVIKELVERSPTSIYFEAKDGAEGNVGKTAYRLLKELDVATAGDGEAEYQDNEDDDDDDDERGREETDSVHTAGSYSAGGELRTSESESVERKTSLEKTEELLKMACIGAPEKECAFEDKLKFLYWEDAKLVRKISLNLRRESKTLDNSYVTNVKKRSGMHFETVLASVQLPYWNPQPQHAEKTRIPGEQAGPPASGATQDSDPYRSIFEWLWKSNVRKIFSVKVNDLGPEPHSNAAIRGSLRQHMPADDTYQDFKVEIFKWKKYDICSETVYAAAPNAKEVHLYSLGNTAVLRSWACTPGLHKMKNLKRLVIKIYPNNTNDEDDCKAYHEEMKLELAENCPRLKYECIEVKYPKSTAGQGDGGGDNADAKGGNNGNGSPIDHTPNLDDWIKQMEPFKNFVVNMTRNTPLDGKPFVKVAVLDDGASLDSLSLNGGQCQSFRADNVEYWVGPCKHGTMMVNCIRKLCPMAQLYIGRLDDSGVAENQKFTTESCFKALEWARKMDVDIISMSWSFKKKDHGKDEGEKKFVNELNQAVNDNNVILFASLPDKGATAEIRKYVPVGNEQVIRIGSATMFGDEAKEIKFADRDFLLPGEEIETPSGESDKGSSYATAYAAGLAALVLHCLRAHKALEDFYIENNHSLKLPCEDTYTAKRLEEAATMAGMRKIFKVLSKKSAKDEIPKKGFFVRPYLALDGKFGANAGQHIMYLRQLGPKILPVD